MKTIGFFKVKTKQQQLQDLNFKLKNYNEKIQIYKKLIAFASHIFFDSQLKIIKKTKHERFQRIMDEFSQTQLMIEDREKALWEVILK